MLNDFDCILSLNKEDSYTPALEYLRFIFTLSLCIGALTIAALVFFTRIFHNNYKIGKKSQRTLK